MHKIYMNKFMCEHRHAISKSHNICSRLKHNQGLKSLKPSTTEIKVLLSITNMKAHANVIKPLPLASCYFWFQCTFESRLHRPPEVDFLSFDHLSHLLFDKIYEVPSKSGCL